MNASITPNAYQTSLYAAGTVVPFESINTPGCYVCNWSGHLLRVSENGVAPGRGGAFQLNGGEPLHCTLISQNPYITKTKARMIAANFNLFTSF